MLGLLQSHGGLEKEWKLFGGTSGGQSRWRFAVGAGADSIHPDALPVKMLETSDRRFIALRFARKPILVVLCFLIVTIPTEIRNIRRPISPDVHFQTHLPAFTAGWVSSVLRRMTGGNGAGL